MEEALISAYDYIGVNLNARVDKLFSNRYEHQSNDFHAQENFVWVPNQFEEDWSQVDLSTHSWDVPEANIPYSYDDHS